jgi:hypothetical protein
MFAWVIYAVRLVAAIVMLSTAGLVGVTGFSNGKAYAASMVTAGLFGLAGFFCWPRRPNAWRSDKPSQKQLAYAESLGIVVPRRATKGQVSDMISDITGR